MSGLERSVIRQVVSVACGADESVAPRNVATPTRREFVINSSSSSEEGSTTEGSVRSVGSSVEAVVGVADRPKTSGGVAVPSVPVIGSPPLGNAVASSSLVRSGKLKSFNDHVIHRISDMLSLPINLRCCLRLFIRYFSSVV